MDFKCLSVASSSICVMEKINSIEQFRNMKKQLLWGRRKERKSFTQKKKKKEKKQSCLSDHKYINVV